MVSTAVEPERNPVSIDHFHCHVIKKIKLKSLNERSQNMK